MLLASILDKIKNGFIENLSLELDTTIMFILDAKVGSSEFFLVDNFPCLFPLLVVNLKYSKIKTKLKMHVYLFCYVCIERRSSTDKQFNCYTVQLIMYIFCWKEHYKAVVGFYQ